METVKSKRKILVYSTAYYPFVAGAEIAVKEITDRLGSEYDFDLIKYFDLIMIIIVS